VLDRNNYGMHTRNIRIISTLILLLSASIAFATDVRTETENIALSEIVASLKENANQIKTIHYKVITTDLKGNMTTSEFLYEEPDKFKRITSEFIEIVRGESGHLLDPATKKITRKYTVDQNLVNIYHRYSHPYMPDFNAFDHYEFKTIERITTIPDNLRELYSTVNTENIYRIEAIPDSEFDIYHTKFEYIVDLDLGLLVSTTGYIPGILGSGIEEEIGDSTVIKKIQKMEDIYLAKEVRFQMSVIDFGEEGIKDNLVKYEIISLNQDIDDNEFLIENK